MTLQQKFVGSLPESICTFQLLKDIIKTANTFPNVEYDMATI